MRKLLRTIRQGLTSEVVPTRAYRGDGHDQTQIVFDARPVVFALACAVPPSLSAPLVWRLQDVKFDDGGTAFGSFTYDASIGKILDWNIVAAKHGADVFGTAIDIHFVNVPGCNDPACDLAQRFGGGLPPRDDFVFSHGDTPASSAFLSLSAARPLTNDPGLVSLVAEIAPAGSYLSCCENAVETGLVSGFLDSAPEPASVFCMLAGIAALVAVQWFRRRSPARRIATALTNSGRKGNRY